MLFYILNTGVSQKLLQCNPNNLKISVLNILFYQCVRTNGEARGKKKKLGLDVCIAACLKSEIGCILQCICHATLVCRL